MTNIPAELEYRSRIVRDVARRAGVSTATVSRVVNRDSGVYAATRVKVLNAFSALRFSPERVRGPVGTSQRRHSKETRPAGGCAAGQVRRAPAHGSGLLAGEVRKSQTSGSPQKISRRRPMELNEGAIADKFEPHRGLPFPAPTCG